jgi:hypothetical protein
MKGEVDQTDELTIGSNLFTNFTSVSTLQIVRMTADFLFTSCAAIFGNQTAVDALYNFGADIFVGDAITACSWIMSDILG